MWTPDSVSDTHLDVFNTHETTDTQITHHVLHDIFNGIDIICCFLILTEHPFTGTAGVRDTGCDSIHDVRYLLHVCLLYTSPGGRGSDRPAIETVKNNIKKAHSSEYEWAFLVPWFYTGILFI